MKITKLGHCCLLIETKGKRILTDPGNYTIEANSQVKNIDYILFTHEHQDHYHLESLKVIIQNNPQAVIYANNSVSELLNKEGMTHTEVKHNESLLLGEINLVGIGEKHEMMHSSIPLSPNLGFFIDDRLWYPGDSFTNPARPIEVLALPVAGPWMKVSEAIDYVSKLEPKVVFPVHDAIRGDSLHKFLLRVLPTQKVEFIPMVEGDVKDFQ